MRDQINAPRFARTRRSQPIPNATEDLEQVFWDAGYRVQVTRLSTKRYRVTFLNNPWKHALEDDIIDDVDEEMEKNLSKWRYWHTKHDPEISDSWLLTAP